MRVKIGDDEVLVLLRVSEHILHVSEGRVIERKGHAQARVHKLKGDVDSGRDFASWDDTSGSRDAEHVVARDVSVNICDYRLEGKVSRSGVKGSDA